jgi:Mn2+/Fe2+ NRAMP family transporter
MTASTPPFDALAGWRYPRTQPSLPVPLVRFTGERRKLGQFANGRLLSTVARSVAAVIVGLNGWLLLGTSRAWVG